MAKKSTFAKTFRSLTDIGKEFNLSARAVGQELKRLGYRGEDGHPTAATLEAGIAVATPLRDGTPYFRWHFTKVRAILAAEHAPDPDKKIREVLKEMLTLYASKDLDAGGGGAYKVAVAQLDECLQALPLRSKPEKVLAVLDTIDRPKRTKALALQHIFTEVARGESPPRALLERLLNEGDRWVWQVLADNPNVDVTTRDGARHRLAAR